MYYLSGESRGEHVFRLGGVPLVLLSQRKLVVFMKVGQTLIFIHLLFVCFERWLCATHFAIILVYSGEKTDIITVHMEFIVCWERCMFTFVFVCSCVWEEKNRGLRRNYSIILVGTRWLQGILAAESHKSSRPGTSKLELMGQLQLATHFCKWSFNGTKTLPFTCVFMTALVLQWQSSVVVTGTVWLCNV